MMSIGRSSRRENLLWGSGCRAHQLIRTHLANHIRASSRENGCTKHARHMHPTAIVATPTQRLTQGVPSTHEPLAISLVKTPAFTLQNALQLACLTRTMRREIMRQAIGLCVRRAPIWCGLQAETVAMMSLDELYASGEGRRAIRETVRGRPAPHMICLAML
jgi:hypothetical protein